MYEGVSQLLNPVAAESFVVAYVVLAVAFPLDLVSFLQAWRHLSGEAQARARGLLEHVRLTSDPTTRAVFAEDAAGVTGNVIAATGIALQQATGSATPDAVEAIGIGLLLGAVMVVFTGPDEVLVVARVGRTVRSAGRRDAGTAGWRQLHLCAGALVTLAMAGGWWGLACWNESVYGPS